MSDIKELQDEEREALISIYEGDTAFKQINPTTFHYKYGEEDDNKSFLLELTWGENYPNEAPTINLDTFYNRNIIPNVKSGIVAAIKEEAEQWIGCGMTYTLFECLKEKNSELLAEQPTDLADIASADVVGTADKTDLNSVASTSKPMAKKEQLTKAQKRRAWEHSDHKGDKPRGYNWVDIVKHLSQTGGKEEGGSVPTNFDG